MTLQPLRPFFADFAALEASIAANAEPEKKIGRPTKGEAPLSDAERSKACRQKKDDKRKRCVAILDMETDPFDAELKADIKPFLAVLYSDEFEPVVIWEQDHAAFIAAVMKAIEALPDSFTIYAHNGGKFDFLFLISKLRGDVKFKGRSLMSARVGAHELRDSSHIIPERLAAFQKDKFDYTRNLKANREHWKKEIIDYCIADCRYTLDIVKSFIENYGMKLTIGQAAMAELRKNYNVSKINQGFDCQLRQFYFGGRVECLEGRGHFVGDYKLFDVNSMYPAVMADRKHPIGGFENYEMRNGPPNEKTVFVKLECSNQGALIGRDAGGFTSGTIPRGKFLTTIWEYNVALKYGLISDITSLVSIDCDLRSDFSKFILPLYENRLATKDQMRALKDKALQNTAAFLDLKKDDIFFKLLLNNSYGKFAMDPSKYREHYLTDPKQAPPDEWFKSIRELDQDEQPIYLQPIFENRDFAIWQKPSPSFRYNNVGTAASITGAARAVLLEALQNAIEPIYCDTDSIICKDLVGVPLHKSQLGAWDLEDQYTQVIIDGKKLYSVWHKSPKLLTPEQIADGHKSEYTVKSKGTARIEWQEMLDLLHGGSVVKFNRAPTLTKFGSQKYLQRTIRATAQLKGIA